MIKKRGMIRNISHLIVAIALALVYQIDRTGAIAFQCILGGAISPQTRMRRFIQAVLQVA